MADGRLKQLERTAKLVADLIKGRTHDRNSAAKLLDLEPPAAARQLEALHRHLPGLEKRQVQKTARYYMAPRARDATPLPLSVAVSACFGASLSPLFQGTTYFEGMKKSLDRVVEGVARAGEFADLDRRFYFHACGGEEGLRDGAEHLDEVVEAVLGSRVLRFTYTTFGGRTDVVRGNALSIIVYEHQLYVIVQVGKDPPYPYRFSRMKEVTCQKRRFEYPPRRQYDPRRLFRDSLGVFVGDKFPVKRVRLRLHPRWSVYVQTHCWHESQGVEFEGDHPVVSIRVRLCPELEAWILSFGDEAEVLGPAELRERVAERVKGARLLYDEASDA